ncbi:hypothetical protein [Streptomyces mirabilis]
MDSTHTAQRRRPQPGLAGRPYAELTDGRLGRPPIHAQLVAEWRAEGRVVPEHREVVAVLWASFAASSPFERAAWPVDSWAEMRDERATGPVPAEPRTVSAVSVPAEPATVSADSVPAVPVPRGLLGW